MKKTLFVGVDGGGTKCVVRLEDETGKLLGREVSGPANIRLSVTQTWESIYAALDKILLQQGIQPDDQRYCLQAGMGLAGCETRSAYEDFLARPHYFETLILSSDAHAACLGAHAGADGAIICIGTGVVGYQIETGKQTKISGWGFPHDDQGSGAWLGLEAVKLTLQSIDGRLPFSALTQSIYAHFEMNLNRFITWASNANSTAYAELAPLVIASFQRGDIQAVQLMQAAAKAVTSISDALIASQSTILPCSLVGSIAPFIEPFLPAHLKARLTPCKATPDVGALQLIRHALASLQKAPSTDEAYDARRV